MNSWGILRFLMKRIFYILLFFFSLVYFVIIISCSRLYKPEGQVSKEKADERLFEQVISGRMAEVDLRG